MKKGKKPVLFQEEEWEKKKEDPACSRLCKNDVVLPKLSGK